MAVRLQLARCLTAQAKSQNDLGFHGQALTAVEEAVSILHLFHRMPDRNQDFVLGLLSDSLDTLQRCLTYLGRVTEALQTIEEAVAMRRELVGINSDAYLPDLAVSLNTLAIELNRVGREEDALVASKESVEIRRALAAVRFSHFQPFLARSLHTLSNILGNLGHSRESLMVIQEVVRMRRENMASFPGGRFRSSLARALRTLAWRLEELGNYKEACTAAKESVALFRPLRRDRPYFFGLPLAMSLYTVGKSALYLDRAKEALEYLQESAGIFRDNQRRTTAERSEYSERLWQEGFAACLQLLGQAYTKCGQTLQARDTSDEVEPLLRALLHQFPHLLRRELGKMLY